MQTVFIEKNGAPCKGELHLEDVLTNTNKLFKLGEVKCLN